MDSRPSTTFGFMKQKIERGSDGRREGSGAARETRREISRRKRKKGYREGWEKRRWNKEVKERGGLGRKNYRSEGSGLVMEKGKEISRDEM